MPAHYRPAASVAPLVRARPDRAASTAARTMPRASIHSAPRRLPRSHHRSSGHHHGDGHMLGTGGTQVPLTIAFGPVGSGLLLAKPSLRRTDPVPAIRPRSSCAAREKRHRGATYTLVGPPAERPRTRSRGSHGAPGWGPAMEAIAPEPRSVAAAPLLAQARTRRGRTSPSACFTVCLGRSASTGATAA
jgi:hypothetical protein